MNFMLLLSRVSKIQLILFCFLPFLAKGQLFYFDNLGVKDGLPQSKIYDIKQDSSGKIWIGTPSGLSIYNGIEFKN